MHFLPYPRVPARIVHPHAKGASRVRRENRISRDQRGRRPGASGLGGFAATTMALSLVNAHVVASAIQPMVLALALLYGGVLQLLAGIWEFRNNRNTSGPWPTRAPGPSRSASGTPATRRPRRSRRDIWRPPRARSCSCGRSSPSTCGSPPNHPAVSHIEAHPDPASHSVKARMHVIAITHADTQHLGEEILDAATDASTSRLPPGHSTIYRGVNGQPQSPESNQTKEQRASRTTPTQRPNLRLWASVRPPQAGERSLPVDPGAEQSVPRPRSQRAEATPTPGRAPALEHEYHSDRLERRRAPSATRAAVSAIGR
jgi:GPR1/FUN34/yaaH family protein